MTNLPSWQAPLQARGILQPALEAHWHPYRTGWRYPIYLSSDLIATLEGKPVYRWKAFDSDSKPKYLWALGDNADNNVARDLWFYALPGLREAVSAANGLLYFVSGEPDVLTLRAAGANNVISLFGENRFPDPLTFITFLQELGATDLAAFPDLDPAGAAWARNLAFITEGSGLKLSLWSLPASLGDKGDLNKLWVSHAFDADRFWDTIISCDPYVMDTTIQPSLAKRERLPGEVDPTFDERSAGYWEQIVTSFPIKAYNSEGWSNLFKCPFHDDSHPSAAINTTKRILYCQAGCGEKGMMEVGDVLGIARSLIQPKERTSTPDGKNVTSAQDTAAPDSIPGGDNGSTGHTGRKNEGGSQAGNGSAGAGKAMSALDRVGRPMDWPQRPLVGPFRSLHEFAGYARSLMPGKMLLVAAQSGGRKTAFTGNWIDHALAQGFNVAVNSPEWTEIELMWWMLARAGGPTYNEFQLAAEWDAELQNGVPESARNGQPFDVSALARIEQIKGYIGSLPGKLYYVNERKPDGNRVMHAFKETEKKAAGEGRRLHLYVWDYIQRVGVGSPNETLMLNAAIGQLEEFVLERRCNAIVVSQITKESARRGEIVTKNDIRSVRIDPFQLALTLNPLEGVSAPAGYEPIGCYVAKNSTGRERDMAALMVKSDTGRFLDAGLATIHLSDYYERLMAAPGGSGAVDETE